MATFPKIYYDTDAEPADDAFADVLPEAEDRHAEYDELASQDEEGAAPVVRVVAATETFAYGVGHRVQPAPEAPTRQVVWRGQLKERHPATGLVHRVNVYRLDDGFWDCYREDDLQAA